MQVSFKCTAEYDPRYETVFPCQTYALLFFNCKSITSTPCLWISLLRCLNCFTGNITTTVDQYWSLQAVRWVRYVYMYIFISKKQLKRNPTTGAESGARNMHHLLLWLNSWHFMVNGIFLVVAGHIKSHKIHIRSPTPNEAAVIKYKRLVLVYVCCWVIWLKRNQLWQTQWNPDSSWGLADQLGGWYTPLVNSHVGLQWCYT